MGKKIWYDRGHKFVEIKVIEPGVPTERYKATKKNYPKVLRILRDKHDFQPKIPANESVNAKRENEGKDATQKGQKDLNSDIDWLKGDLEW